MLGVLGTVSVRLVSPCEESFPPTAVCLSPNASSFEQQRKGGSLSVLQAEPGATPFSLGMFRKCEWRSVPRAARCRPDELQSVPLCLRERSVYARVCVRAPTALTGFLQEACKPVICVVPSLALCGPVGGDQKIH